MTEVPSSFQRMWLSDVDVTAISLVDTGANGRRIFLYKSANQQATLPVETRIVKSAGTDWTSFYIVVAEPGREEEPGVAEGTDQSIRDVWASEDEIRKAAHRFMHNGALVNQMHADLEPYGTLVENAIALADLQVGDETIKKGSWYIAIEPTAQGRAAVESGEFSGVSIEGSGIRTPAKAHVEKGTPVWMTEYDRDLISAIASEPITKAGSSASLPDLDWSAGQNWIDRLPAALGAAFKASWIYRAAKHLTYEVYGGNRGHAFAVAIEAARKGCATGDLNWPGAQQVNAGSRAEMCAAVALWEQMKAAAHSQSISKEAQEAIDHMSETTTTTVDFSDDERSLFTRMGERLGLIPAPSNLTPEELAKQAGKTSGVSESTENSTEQRVAALEKSVGELSEAVKPLAALPEAIEKLSAKIPEPEAKGPTADELVERLEKSEADSAKLREDIAKLAEGGSSQSGDELSNQDRDAIEKARAGGDGWQTEVLA